MHRNQSRCHDLIRFDEMPDICARIIFARITGAIRIQRRKVLLICYVAHNDLSDRGHCRSVVIKLVNIEEHELIDRDMMMVKIVADEKERGQILQLAEVFRARVVDMHPQSIVIEISGSPRKLDAFLNMIDHKKIREMARTGVTGVAVTGSGKCLDL